MVATKQNTQREELVGTKEIPHPELKALLVSDSAKQLTGAEGMLLERMAKRVEKFSQLPEYTQKLLDQKTKEQYGMNYLDLQARCAKELIGGVAVIASEQTATWNISSGDLPAAVVRADTVAQALGRMLASQELFQGEELLMEFEEDAD